MGRRTWYAVLCLVALVAACSWAQEPPPPPPSPPPGAAVPDATIPIQPGVPTSPAGVQHAPEVPVPGGRVPSPVAPSLPPSGYVPPPQPPPVTELPSDFMELEGEVRTTFENGVPVHSTADNVTIRYKDFVITGKHAEVDYRTNIAVVEGNVVVRTGVEEARGESVTVNLRTREWTVSTAATTITPEYARGWLRAPVFVQGQRLEGLGQRQIDAFGVETTTCNLATPHYEFVSRSLTVYPNNKIILRHVTMYALGRRLFTIPRFVVPLREIERNPRVVPNVGQSQEEGYFLKTAYSWLGTRSQAGFILLDLMSRKGIGKGLRHSWRLPNAFGDAQIYQLFDRNIQQDTLTGRLTHSQAFGTIRANVSTDFRSNSYVYAPQSKTLINRLTLTRDRPGANSSFSLIQNVSNSFARTSTLSSFLKHRQLFGQDTSLDTNLEYTGYTSSGTRARLTSQMLFTRREDKFDWSVSAQKLTDLSDEAFAGQGIFAGIERLPEIGLVTDTTRLGRFLPFGIPARLKVTNGHYVELPATTSLNRTFLEFTSPIQRHNFTDTWSFGAGAGFRQYIYSDNTAQYSLDTSAEVTKRLGQRSSFDLTYRFQRPRGFSPFRFDYVGRYNILTGSLNLQDSQRFRVSLLTGYNFEQSQFPWQDVTIRLAFQPTNSLLLYTATGYDVNNSQWRTLINQLRIRGGERLSLDVGTRYDTIRQKLAAGRLVLSSLVTPGTSVQAVTSYNGFTRSFDYTSVMVTKDLHCWEASLVYTRQTGFYESQGISLNLRIKAFPYFREFGAGQFGQALDTSVGQVY